MSDVLGRSNVEFETTYLDGGLHSDPARLRRELQAAIDDVDDGPAERIIIGYGVCGRGTVGIHARSKPLVIPRVHDCIALFLGADSKYRREFSKCPGSYYISAGWYDEKVQPRGTGDARHVDDPRDGRSDRIEIEMLSKRYGEENAREIQHFLGSWKRNYRRAAFIDTGAGTTEKYESYARAMADAFDWEYERLEGSQELLNKAIYARVDSSQIAPEDLNEQMDDILIVPPGFVTRFDPKERKLVSDPKSDLAETKMSGESEESTPSNDLLDLRVAPVTTVASSIIHTTVEDVPADSVASSGNHSIGIGIDTGGTYTDAVIFDMKHRSVLATGKALTTKWNYTEGITEALSQLDDTWFTHVDLVSVSTTLATNAIVEGAGQKTGLILMPHGFVDVASFEVPTVVVPGRIDISGNEIEPIDDKRIAEVALEMKRVHGVQAFAVSGYAGSLNPAHEISAKQIIEETTGCDVCCGHELSDMLDFYVRANTAVLNAGIIPLLERFLKDVESVLDDLGIGAPVMVVKGDGTLMRAAYARQHPVETVLSGPAASIAGARYITDLEDATVVDVGGTTSDIGKLANRNVRIRKEGAEVGTWRTHVQAIDMRTVGLGGDSEVCIVKQELKVGPRRVAPVCWLASRWETSKRNREFDYLKERLDDIATDTRLAELFWSTGRKPDFALNEQEERVLESLAPGPLTTLHLVEKTESGHPILLRTDRLEAEHIIQRCGLTPTDLLHTTGDMKLWDKEAALQYAMLIASVTGASTAEFAKRALGVATKRLMFELVRRQLDHASDLSEVDDSGLLDVILDGGNRHLRAKLTFTEPIVGLGAAAELFLAPVVERIEAKVIIPQYAAVANAVGAITSMVVVTRLGSIVPAADGAYHLTGLSGMHRFSDFESANDRLLDALDGMVRSDAEAAGTEERNVEFEINDRMSATADGAELFLEREITARITGPPAGAKV
jgi:N-methylhydantoinase A/oxoprolinase/acetone carboxylase beta subunit